MLRLSIIVIALWAIVSCDRVPGTGVTLHVNEVTGDDKAKLVTSDSIYEVALDSTGTAVFVLPEGQQAGYATLRYREAYLSLYVENGKDFNIDLKIEGENVTSRFAGKGAKKNEYLNKDVFAKFEPDFKAGESDFIASLEVYEAEFNAILDSMGFDARFNESEKKRLHYLAYCYLPSYIGAHMYMAGNMTYKPSDDYYNKLRELIQEDESLLDDDLYKKVLIEAIGTICSRDLEGDDVDFIFLKRQLDLVDKTIRNPAIASYCIVHSSI